MNYITSHLLIKNVCKSFSKMYLLIITIKQNVVIYGFPPKEIIQDPSTTISSFLSKRETVQLIETENEKANSVSDTDKQKKKRTNTISKKSSSKRIKSSKPKDTTNNVFTNEKDIFEDLINTQIGDLIQSVENSSENERKPVRSIRKALKECLIERQQETIANKRFESMISGQYEFTMLNAYRLMDSMPSVFKVKYKSNNDKDYIEEIHQAFTKEELKSIITIVLEDPDDKGMELLKPYKMTLYSPRTFWSLLYHFKDVKKGLETLFPLRDWSYLEERKKLYTERAKKMIEECGSIYYESDDEELTNKKKGKKEDEEYIDKNDEDEKDYKIEEDENLSQEEIDIEGDV